MLKKYSEEYFELLKKRIAVRKQLEFSMRFPLPLVQESNRQKLAEIEKEISKYNEPVTSSGE